MRRIFRVWPILVLLPLLSGQPAATVDGVVVNAATSAPVRKALVTLRTDDGRSGYQTLAGDDGRFHFENVQPAKYALCAEAQGFAPTVPAAGAVAPFSLQVTAVADHPVRDLSIPLSPHGVIAGKIVDENGDPVMGAAVQAVRYGYTREGKRLYRGSTLTRKTNQRGQYRLYDTPAGRWYLEITKDVDAPLANGRVHNSTPERRFAHSFFPGVTDETAAAAINLQPGAELTGIDVRLPSVRAYHIRGVVIDARTGKGAPQALVHVDGEWYSTVRPDGAFDLAGMTPGTHALFGDIKGADRIASAIQQITVTDRDVDDVTFGLLPPVSIQGVVLMDGAPATNMTNTRVYLDPLFPLFSQTDGTVLPDGSFEIAGAVPGSYRVSLNMRARNRYLASIRFGDRDVTEDARIEVSLGGGSLTLAFSGNAARISGAVRPVPSGLIPVSITVAPQDRFNGRADLLKTVEPDQETGSFEVVDLPPGEYKLFAWELGDEEIAGYSEFRRLLESKATAITLQPGESKTVQPTVITAAEIAEARRKLP